jgi:hypothetical protein
MSRYSTSAKNDGSTHVAFGFLMGFVSLDFGLTTVLSCLRIWPDTVRDHDDRLNMLVAPTLMHADAPDLGERLDERRRVRLVVKILA